MGVYCATVLHFEHIFLILLPLLCLIFLIILPDVALKWTLGLYCVALLSESYVICGQVKPCRTGTVVED